MLKNNKCTLVYGLSEDETLELQKQGLKLLNVSKEMLGMKVNDILDGLKILKYNNIAPEEKVILFNDYSDSEVKDNVTKIRKVIKGAILAVVTPVSIEWTFQELMDHLISEREWFRRNQEKGR